MESVFLLGVENFASAIVPLMRYVWITSALPHVEMIKKSPTRNIARKILFVIPTRKLGIVMVFALLHGRVIIVIAVSRMIPRLLTLAEIHHKFAFVRRMELLLQKTQKLAKMLDNILLQQGAKVWMLIVIPLVEEKIAEIGPIAFVK